MLKKLIFDCDNTMGIEGYPMDDALAFLYILGNKEKVDLEGLDLDWNWFEDGED